MPYSHKIIYDEDLISLVAIYFRNGGNLNMKIKEFIKNLLGSIKKSDGISLELFELINLTLNLISNPQKQINSQNGEITIMSQAFRQEIFNCLFKYSSWGIKDKAEKKFSHFLGYNLLTILIQVNLFIFYFYLLKS